MKFNWIEPGSFLMGSPDSDKDAGSDEKPQHPVEITKPFFMGVYPVTKGRFAAFVKDAGYQTEAEKAGEKTMWQNPFTGYTQTDNDPVVEVSWNDAVNFCAWLSMKEGRTCELPTEAEWEYACRAGTKTAFSCGDDPKALGDYAWYDDHSGDHTHPVGEKKANPWGLNDMHGDVWQWCVDGKRTYQKRCIKDPKAPNNGSRVLRGGSWVNGPHVCRSAIRFGNGSGLRLDFDGFRVVLRVPARTT